MILDLARGKLPSQESESLRARLLSSRQSRDWTFYRVLAEQLGAERSASSKDRWSVLWQSRSAVGLLAALLTIALALPLFHALQSSLEAENRRLIGEVKKLEQAAASAPLRATFFLSPLTRSNLQATTSLQISDETELIELWLEPTYRDGQFRVVVSQSGELILKQEVIPLERDLGAVVPVEIDTKSVSAGFARDHPRAIRQRLVRCGQLFCRDRKKIGTFSAGEIFRVGLS